MQEASYSARNLSDAVRLDETRAAVTAACIADELERGASSGACGALVGDGGLVNPTPAYERQTNRELAQWLQQPERLERRIGRAPAARCEG
jgi:hypothetical protein